MRREIDMKRKINIFFEKKKKTEKKRDRHEQRNKWHGAQAPT